MRMIGLILFYLGIIIALISAAKLPEAHSLLSDMLPIYMGAILLAFMGLLFVYISHKKYKKQYNKKLSQHTTKMTDLLQGLLAEMQHLGQDIDSMDGKEITTRVSALLDNQVLPFIAIREEVLCLLGHYQGVEVLVAAAQGERLLNRMWSAASDGVVNEARRTYPNALAAFEEAYRRTLIPTEFIQKKIPKIRLSN